MIDLWSEGVIVDKDDGGLADRFTVLRRQKIALGQQIGKLTKKRHKHSAIEVYNVLYNVPCDLIV